MSKSKDDLLLAYKKTNKQRRPAIVKKAGFVTEAEYLAYLLNNVELDTIPIVHNVYIVDISGSMQGGKINAAVRGVNIELDALKEDNTVEYTQTIVEFSGYDQIRTKMYKVPIKEAGTYSTRANGSTALNQAVGETLEQLRIGKNPEEKVLIKIFTDGGENDSHGVYDPRRGGNSVLADLIKTCENEGFTVTFVGTDNDVRSVIDTLHVHASNTYSHDNTTKGVELAFMASRGATLAYSKNVRARKAVDKGFYKTIK